MTSVMVPPAGRSVVPVMIGWVLGLRLPEVRAICGGVMSTMSVCVSRPVLPAGSVAVARMGTLPFRPPAGKAPPDGMALAVSTDQAPPAPTTVW